MRTAAYFALVLVPALAGAWLGVWPPDAAGWVACATVYGGAIWQLTGQGRPAV